MRSTPTSVNRGAGYNTVIAGIGFASVIEMSVQELDELSKKVSQLQQECSFLRCLAISDSSCFQEMATPNGTYLEEYISARHVMNQNDAGCDINAASRRRGLEVIYKQKEELLKSMEHLQAEGNDVYDSIAMSTKEKEDMIQELNTTLEAVDTCKRVIDFLVKERDQMKKEIELKDSRIVEYTESFRRHPELMLQAQNPLVHRVAQPLKREWGVCCIKQELGSLVMWVVGVGWSWGVSAFQRRHCWSFHMVFSNPYRLKRALDERCGVKGSV